MGDNLVSTLSIDTMNSANNITFDNDHVNAIENNMSDSEDDMQVTTTRITAKLPQFTSSDSDTDKENKCKKPVTSSPQKQSSDNDNSKSSSTVLKKKSRLRITTNSDSDTDNENERKNPSIPSPLKQVSDDDNNRISCAVPEKKSRRRHFLNSDSDIDTKNDVKNPITSSPLKYSSDVGNGISISKKKSRIKNFSNSESESQAENESTESTSKYDLTRTKIKNKKLKDKFKKLINTTHTILKGNEIAQSELSDGKSSKGSDASDEENSCLKIKQKIMKKSTHSLASICDPDTSDEESHIKIRKPKSTKPTSPKPIRMSAKQAMENMQKIKSESNRMLREKEVSLPYHRPKALTLKDIMSRRRPAITSDGKSLPIKMNSEQLKQYASLLEQRQKEMMELCISDTEEEEDMNCPDKEVSSNLSNKSGSDENCGNTEVNEAEENCVVSSELNDKTFDDIIMEEKVNEAKAKIVEESIGVNDLVHENNKEQTKSDNILTVSENTTGLEVIHAVNEENIPQNEPLKSIIDNQCTEEESQVISLHYDTDKTELTEAGADNEKNNANKIDEFHKEINDIGNEKENLTDEFSDNDFTMEELDSVLENAEINKDIRNKPLSNLHTTMTMKPKLTGGPGMVINLDEDGSNTSKKLTGVELLKERFTYFVKLKSLEDKEKDREKKFKPGIQHLKLKQELEEQIAEQRSLEWEKRLEEENKLKAEINEVDNAEEFDGENIEKIEAELEESEAVDEEESSSGEEEDDIDMSEKPRKRNPLVDEEAEVSEDETAKNDEDKTGNDECENDNDEENDGSEADENYSSSEEDDDSSESEDEQMKPKKGRILKAFEDSDDEEPKSDSIPTNNPKTENESNIPESQDDDIQLAQPQRSFSEDLFTSQECSQKSINMTDKPKDSQNNTSADNDLGTQTFSILQSGSEDISNTKNISSEKLDIICETQPSSYDNFEAIVGMCTGNFTENLVTPQYQSSQLSQSQELGDDVAAMCTGKFYDNPLIPQSEIDNEISNENNTGDDSINVSNAETQINDVESERMVKKLQIDDTNSEAGPENEAVKNIINSEINIKNDKDLKNSKDFPNKVNEGENRLLKSILDELDDPEFDLPKPNKYFVSDNRSESKDNKNSAENTQLKKKFIIESDEETNGEAEVSAKKKKRKKRKLEDRALQFSDDEDEYSEQEEDTYVSDLEDDNNRLVEYDSEENEVEVQVKAPRKKRIGKDFFEQEAELTSEDEWIGSGDEDEAGLDRMEREEGDDDTFHQGKLQRELGEIHMREVLDQDKREVRLLQELLFEDGDLGDGHRQRKFRWKNADGEEEMGTNADEYVADTQEDEFESEEQWRKQRHEREMFLRKLQEKDEKDASIRINRSALIKATLISKTSVNVTESVTIDIEKPKLPEAEKKAVNDVPLVKEPFIIFQKSYHNSLLTRGRGALARLAALATPLAGDGDDTPKVNASSSRGNFVFAAITPDDAPKVTKRKADANPETPRLLKKIRKQDSSKNSKTSLLDHL